MRDMADTAEIAVSAIIFYIRLALLQEIWYNKTMEIWYILDN